MDTTDILLTYISIILSGGVSILGFNSIVYYIKLNNEAKYIKIFSELLIKYLEHFINKTYPFPEKFPNTNNSQYPYTNNKNEKNTDEIFNNLTKNTSVVDKDNFQKLINNCINPSQKIVS